MESDSTTDRHAYHEDLVAIYTNAAANGLPVVEFVDGAPRKYAHTAFEVPPNYEICDWVYYLVRFYAKLGTISRSSGKPDFLNYIFYDTAHEDQGNPSFRFFDPRVTGPIEGASAYAERSRQIYGISAKDIKSAFDKIAPSIPIDAVHELRGTEYNFVDVLKCVRGFSYELKEIVHRVQSFLVYTRTPEETQKFLSGCKDNYVRPLPAQTTRFVAMGTLSYWGTSILYDSIRSGEILVSDIPNPDHHGMIRAMEDRCGSEYAHRFSNYVGDITESYRESVSVHRFTELYRSTSA